MYYSFLREFGSLNLLTLYYKAGLSVIKISGTQKGYRYKSPVELSGQSQGQREDGS